MLSRLARYKNMSPELALSITAKKQFLFAIAAERDPVKLEEAIDNELLGLVDQLRASEESRAEEIARLQGALHDETGRRQVAEEDVATARETIRSLRRAQLRWLAFAFLLTGVSLLLWLHGSWLGVPSLLSLRNGLLVSIASQLLVLVLLLNLPLNRHWKLWLALAVTLLAAVLTTARV